jgi:ABC-type transport system involved in multi-copper enzyme maturation permease subunit
LDNLARAEWFKMSRFWLTWTLFILLIGIVALQVNAHLNEIEEMETEVETGLSAYDGSPLSPFDIEGNLIRVELLREELRYPTFIGTVARLSTGFGWFAIILFTAVVGGEDFSRKTLGVILVRGVRRLDYLFARTIAIWLATGFVVVTIAALAAIVGLYVHTRVTVDPISIAGFGKALLWVFRSWFTFLPFIVVTLFWAVLARHPGPALGLGIALHALEVLNGLVLPFVATVIANAQVTGIEVPRLYLWQVELFSVTLGYNANVFLHWGTPFQGDAIYILKTMGLEYETLLPVTPWRAMVLLVGYIVVFLGWAMWILQRRDITYGS